MEKQPKSPSTETWIKKIIHIHIYNEILVHIFNEILLSHKKERNCDICWDLDGLGDCHTEWSKSEREKQILYINTYMWNLENTNESIRKAKTETQTWRINVRTPTRELGCEVSWEIKIDICVLLCIKYITIEDLCRAQGTLHSVLWWLKSERNPKKKGYMYMHRRFALLYSRN